MYIIYRDNAFQKCLDSLIQGGGTGAGAARRAEALIERLAGARADGSNVSEICRITRNGEARIRNCRKYDLGEGYRLITICKGRHLVLLYAGSHDDCDRWLKRNRGFTPVIGPEPVGQPAAAFPPVSGTPFTDGEGDEDEYETELMKRISERDLRYVFRGLWDKPQRKGTEPPPLGKKEPPV